MTGEFFEYSNPRVERVISGHGVIRRLGQEVERLGGSRALIVTSPSVVRSDIFNGLREGLGSLCVGTFDRVRPHSPTEVIEEAAEELVWVVLGVWVWGGWAWVVEGLGVFCVWSMSEFF